jgi:hypothetical protein
MTRKMKRFSLPRRLYDTCRQTMHIKEAKQCACFTTTRWNEEEIHDPVMLQHDFAVVSKKEGCKVRYSEYRERCETRLLAESDVLLLVKETALTRRSL